MYPWLSVFPLLLYISDRVCLDTGTVITNYQDDVAVWKTYTIKLFPTMDAFSNDTKSH